MKHVEWEGKSIAALFCGIVGPALICWGISYLGGPKGGGLFFLTLVATLVFMGAGVRHNWVLARWAACVSVALLAASLYTFGANAPAVMMITGGFSLLLLFIAGACSDKRRARL